MITAQMLYDLRERDGEIDGNDLHDLFRYLCSEPSPPGYVIIPPINLVNYAEECHAGYLAHKSSGGVGGTYLLDIASFCLRYRAAAEIAEEGGYAVMHDAPNDLSNAVQSHRTGKLR